MTLLSFDAYRAGFRTPIGEPDLIVGLTKLNEAHIRELCQIKGVGPVTAKRIVDDKPPTGYDSIEQLPVNDILSNRIKAWIEL